jgi:hypothetical protein
MRGNDAKAEKGKQKRREEYERAVRVEICSN